MAVYRVEIDVNFKEENEAIAFINLVEDIKTKVDTATYPSPDASNAIRCRYHKCYHDEDPLKPCGDYTNIDFKGAEEVHKNEAGKEVMYTNVNTTTQESIGP